jgi:hypothetical protein
VCRFGAKVPGATGFAVEHLVFGTAEQVAADARYRFDSRLTRAGQKLASDLGRAIAELQRAVPATVAQTLGLRPRQHMARIDAVSEHLRNRSDLADLRQSVAALKGWLSTLEPIVVFAHGDRTLGSCGCLG